jgi:hypothetical protein
VHTPNRLGGLLAGGDWGAADDLAPVDPPCAAAQLLYCKASVATAKVERVVITDTLMQGVLKPEAVQEGHTQTFTTCRWLMQIMLDPTYAPPTAPQPAC